MVSDSKDFDIVGFCRNSTKYTSLVAFAASKVENLLPLRLSLTSEQVQALQGEGRHCSSNYENSSLSCLLPS